MRGKVRGVFTCSHEFGVALCGIKVYDVALSLSLFGHPCTSPYFYRSFSEKMWYYSLHIPTGCALMAFLLFDRDLSLL